jgi:hypothetical protein
MSEVAIQKGFRSRGEIEKFQATLKYPERYYIVRIVEDLFHPDDAVIGYFLKEVE